MQSRKPTLVYDLVEEYRQPFVDRAVFSLLTKGQKGRDLKLDKNTGLLTTETRNQVIKAVLGRLAGLISYRGKKIKAEDVIGRQVDHLVKFLVENKSYRPFVAAY